MEKKRVRLSAEFADVIGESLKAKHTVERGYLTETNAINQVIENSPESKALDTCLPDSPNVSILTPVHGPLLLTSMETQPEITSPKSPYFSSPSPPLTIITNTVTTIFIHKIGYLSKFDIKYFG